MRECYFGGNTSIIDAPPATLMNSTSARATLRGSDYVVLGAILVEQDAQAYSGFSSVTDCSGQSSDQSNCDDLFDSDNMFHYIKDFSRETSSTASPTRVALSTTDTVQSLKTLKTMREQQWIRHDTNALQTKFTVFRQSFDPDAGVLAVAAAPGEYYCHILVRIDFPAMGGTTVTVEVTQFSTPGRHRFAPSYVFAVSCIAMGCLFHLRLLFLEWVDVGMYRCMCNFEESG